MKSYTDLEQSRKLVEILPLESADMYIYKYIFFGELSCFNGTTQVGEYVKLTDKENIAYPCWSLTALLSVLPDYTLQTNTDGTAFVVCESKKPMISDTYDNPVDACYEMILKLHELKML